MTESNRSEAADVDSAPAAAEALQLADGEDRFDAEMAARAIASLLEQGDHATLRTWFEDTLAADIAEALDLLEPSHLLTVLPLMEREERARVFGYLPLSLQVDVVSNLKRDAVVELFDRMGSDERADLFNELPEVEQERLLPTLAHAEREDIRRLASYAEDTAGAIMTSDYAALAANLTAREAMEELRRVAPDKETIYNAYVLDAERKLIGVVTLRKLITAPPNARVSDLMETNVVTAYVDDDQKEVAEKIQRYDFIALPILNGGDRLVGIVTADDAMDVAEEEATESFQRVGTVGPLDVSVKDASIGLLYRKRIFWLVLLVFGNIFSGAGIAYFEDTIAAHLALLFFLPLLIASAGNAGTQASTLMVRAMATGDVVMRDWARMLGREFVVATVLGVTMALAIYGIGVWRGGPEIAVVVGATMILVVIVGSLIGMSLPFIMSRVNLDPATASGPLVTSIADVAGVLIYFGIATALLTMPAG